MCYFFFFFQAEDGIRDLTVTGVQTCALPIWGHVDAELRRLRRCPQRGEPEIDGTVDAPRFGDRIHTRSRRALHAIDEGDEARKIAERLAAITELEERAARMADRHRGADAPTVLLCVAT